MCPVEPSYTYVSKTKTTGRAYVEYLNRRYLNQNDIRQLEFTFRQMPAQVRFRAEPRVRVAS